MQRREQTNVQTSTASDGTKTIVKTTTVTLTDSNGKVTKTVTTETSTEAPGGYSDQHSHNKHNHKSDCAGGNHSIDSMFNERMKLTDDSAAPCQSLDEFRKDAVDRHNELRAKHSVAKLTMDCKLNAVAQDWAEHLAKIGTLQHRPRDSQKYGENCFYAQNSRGVTGAQVVDSWYDEIKQFNFNANDHQSDTGHFTQVVWAGSERMGVGMAKGPNHQYYVVANYDPRGNMLGDFQKNVKKLK